MSAGSHQSYQSYLRLPQLLAQQVPLSRPAVHGELLFIVVHQTHELWFKSLLHDLAAIRDALLDGRPWPARDLFWRVHRVTELLIEQVTILESLPHREFLLLRDALGQASGLQSAQFRELETLSGGRRAGAGPSVWDAYLALVGARGLPVDGRLPDSLDEIEASPDVFPDLCGLAQDLRRHDELWITWRQRHLLMAEGFIGAVPGTGGTGGTAFLASRAAHRYYPLLWRTPSCLAAAHE
ncbi:hypothetical protein J5X84_24120 [Streptosporangiaceae bacterium NEAU-GS5]|nr:hypothetical protein [Streptosporangiaceae bacterium NEAU-GS5]